MRCSPLFPLVLLLGGTAPTGETPSPTDTRLLSQPAVSATRIAFAYAGDLWTARLDGTEVRHLTTALGDESNPVFSPDGAWIAFAGNYDGNTDVYVIPSTGGEPRRLTWHPDADLPQAFTPDGRSVLFTSPRADYSGRHTRLWTVPLTGGAERGLAVPNAAQATYSPDGRSIAYNPNYRRFEQRKGYRGGAVSQLWLVDTLTWGVEKIPQPPGRSNDVDAMWTSPGEIWFRSDRDGELNLYRYDRSAKTVERITHHTDFPVMAASAGGGKIIYEQAGWLHLLDLTTRQSKRLVIGVPAELKERRPRWVKGTDLVRSVTPSPDGRGVVLEMRGEVITLSASGTWRNLTGTSGANDRGPVWSPDGRSIAFLSDRGGEYQLHLAPADGLTTDRVVPLAGAGFYSDLAWSPDGKRIAYRDNAQTIYVVDLATGRSRRVAGNRVYSLLDDLSYAWSPDSRWLAYVYYSEPFASVLSLYDATQDRSTVITDGLSDVAEPVFDPAGHYLYFFASTTGGPRLDWDGLRGQALPRTRTIHAVLLDHAATNPFVQSRANEPLGEATGPAPIELEGIGRRIVPFPISAADLGSLAVGARNQVYYIRAADGNRVLRRYDVGQRSDTAMLGGVDDVVLADQGRTLLYRSGADWFLTDAGTPKPAAGRLPLDAIDLRIDPPAEWAQVFTEAWRINRDYFYAPNFHGVDWASLRDKYAPLLSDAATRGDTDRIIRWLLSELRVSHSYLGPGPRPEQPPRVSVGLLGADIVPDHDRYRIVRIYRGSPWDASIRSPLANAGGQVSEGDYLLAVNGVPLGITTNLYAPFENTADRPTEITIGPRPDGTGARTVSVTPIASEAALRNRSWVEANVRTVDSATGGRAGYLFLPNTGRTGYQAFNRYYYPQAHKDALIVDERYNSGGALADYYLDILRQQPLTWWAARYGDDTEAPGAAIAGPKVLLIDENAGSGGDYFPWMFRKLGIGPLVGQRTGGALVGLLGAPTLIDGGWITAPNHAIWTSDDGYIIENEGVVPDLEVEQTPKDLIAGHDPQLERAIKWVSDELAKHPPVHPRRPAYPDKTKRP